jgi:glutamine cyclotransferase
MKKALLITIVVVAAIILLSASTLLFLNNNRESGNSTLEHYTYSIVNTYPHDSAAFTEGLAYSNGFLYESTGSHNSLSSLRLVNLTTGNVMQEYTLPSQYFGEGIAIVNNTIIQLTWQSHIGFIYDKNGLALVGNFTYLTEGWGLTFDGKNLIMSDGTDQIYFLDPNTFQRTGQIQVHDVNTSLTEITVLITSTVPFTPTFGTPTI